MEQPLGYELGGTVSPHLRVDLVEDSALRIWAELPQKPFYGMLTLRVRSTELILSDSLHSADQIGRTVQDVLKDEGSFAVVRPRAIGPYLLKLALKIRVHKFLGRLLYITGLSSSQDSEIIRQKS